MIRVFIYFILCVISFDISAQVFPVNPNNFDIDRKKTGTWTILFDSNWNHTDKIDSIKYYRVINYNKGLPKGKVSDYYISGKKQWEGYLLSDYPEEILDNTSTFYNMDTTCLLYTSDAADE